MVRSEWLNLNGLWDYSIVDRRSDIVPGPGMFDGKILVPFPVESALSGVMKKFGDYNKLWYHRTFDVPASWRGRRVLLHFGAVDWSVLVFVNGTTLHTSGWLRRIHVRRHERAEGERAAETARGGVGSHGQRHAAARQAGEQAERHLVHVGDRHLANGVDRAGARGGD